jgi:ribonuclease D
LGIELAIPTENLISPEIIRRIAWLSQSDTALIGDSARISERMVNFGARIWQAELTAELVAAGLTNDQPLELPEPVELKEPSSEPET